MRNKARHFRFSLKSLLLLVTLVAFALGAWIVSSQSRIREIESLRDQGTIVRLVCNPPSILQSIGLKNTWPLFVEPFVIELYVSPVEGGARLGDDDTVFSKEDAFARLLEQKAEASRMGASDIQLAIVMGPGRPPMEWLRFGTDNFGVSVCENESRYLLRLAANRENGANINPTPERTETTGSPLLVPSSASE